MNVTVTDQLAVHVDGSENVNNDESLVDIEFRGSMPVVDWTEKIRMFVYKPEQTICYDAEVIFLYDLFIFCMSL